MGLNRQEKAAVVEEVGALVASSQSIVVAEYRGLDVDAITRLRKQARSQGVQLRVLKNTLARRAVGGPEPRAVVDVEVAARPACAGQLKEAPDERGAVRLERRRDA